MLLAACFSLLLLARAAEGHGRAPLLPLSHRLLAEALGGHPEQVHLSLGATPDQMLISWSEQRRDASEPVTVSYGRSVSSLDTTVYRGTVAAYSSLQFYDTTQLLHPDMEEVQQSVSAAELVRLLTLPELLGGSPANAKNVSQLRPTFGVAANADNIYASPLLLTVTLHNLAPNTTYHYRLGAHSTTRAFTTPPQPGPEAYPFAMALFADVGQTIVSHRIITRLAEDADTRLVLLAGDVTYADGLGERWDSGMRLLSPLAGAKPLMVCAGNHELERGEAFQHLVARFPTPYVWSGSPDPLYYDFRAGPAHVFVLNSYVGAAGLPRMAAWLRHALQNVDRNLSPWLVAMWHAPAYSSLSSKMYSKAGMPLRWALEEMLFEAGVDLVVCGHVHAYERTHPVYNNSRNECGPVHLTVGDAGAHGGPHVGWKSPAPEWSAFRSSTFGAGKLVLHNATHARWTWTRAACATTANINDPDASWSPIWDDDGNNCTSTGDLQHEHVDSTWLTRSEAACSNKRTHKL